MRSGFVCLWKVPGFTQRGSGNVCKFVPHERPSPRLMESSDQRGWCSCPVSIGPDHLRIWKVSKLDVCTRPALSDTKRSVSHAAATTRCAVRFWSLRVKLSWPAYGGLGNLVCYDAANDCQHGATPCNAGGSAQICLFCLICGMSWIVLPFVLSEGVKSCSFAQPSLRELRLAVAVTAASGRSKHTMLNILRSSRTNLPWLG